MSAFVSGGKPRAWLRLVLFYGVTLVGMAALMFAAAALNPGPRLVTLDDFVSGRINPWRLTAVGLLPLAPVVAATLLARRFLDGRPPVASLGLQPRRLPAGLFGGFAAGVVFLVLNVVIITALGGFKISARPLAAGDGVALVGGLAFFLVFAALEELSFRGYPIKVLDESWRRWGAVFVTSLAFSLLHLANPGSNLLPVVNIAAAGAILALLYLQSGSLWLAISFHWGWNVAEGPIFGTAVSGMASHTTLFIARAAGPAWLSGGGFGPEASVVLTATAACVIVSLLVFQPFRRPGRVAVVGGSL